MSVILGQRLLKQQWKRNQNFLKLYANFFTDHLPIITTNVDRNSNEFQVSIFVFKKILINRFYYL